MAVTTTTRRGALGLGAGALALAVTRPATATSDERAAAVLAFTGGAPVREGRVLLDLPALVENGNSAPLTVTVESPMTAADHVRRIAVFNERNPEPGVITATFGPHADRASLSTRVRLAGSQRLTAVAETSDGTYWAGGADVIVTLAACVEG